MAIVVGNQVALLASATNTVAQNRSGNFVFGVAVVVGGTVTVQWENGSQSASLPEATLDLISSLTGAGFAGKIVKITGYDSSYYLALVLRTYARQPGGAGAAADYALVQLVNSGAKMEVPIGLLTAVPGQ